MSESTLVIVALPNDDEWVHRISSEKMAHMTILYLGKNVEVKSELRTLEFLKHAGSLLEPFVAQVDSRGSLGKDDADVLFFRPSSVKPVADLRHWLLQNRDIRAAYDSVEQHPTWTPHLTLGYPEKPAKNDGNIYWVAFDRIALWNGDSVGPTYRLRTRDQNEAVSMSELTAETSMDEVLRHYGVKGMKWGVRNSEPAPSAARKSKDASQAHKIESKIKSDSGRIDSISNKDLDALLKRANLEQRYSKMLEEKSTMAKGKKQIEKLKSQYKTIQEVDKLFGSPISKALAKKLAELIAKATLGR